MSSDGKPRAAAAAVRDEKPHPKVATVSHTLAIGLADRLREFAFRERISESAVIEHALIALFDQGDDATLGRMLRDRGAALRRKT